MIVRLSPSTVLLSALLASTSAGCSDGSAKFGPAPSRGEAGVGDDEGHDDGGTSSTGGSSSGGKSGGAPTNAGTASSGADNGGAETLGGSGSAGGAPIECNAAPSEAPDRKWVNATGNLAGMESECGNLGLVSAQPCSRRVIAGVAKKGLWQTQDGGQTWQPLGTAANSHAISNRVSAIVYDPLDSKIFWESGIYNGGCAYKTTDNGVTFEQLGQITHCDSVSVDFSDPERKTLLAGAHESNNPLHLSTNGGATWSNVAPGLPGGFCTSTLVLDATTFLVGCNSGSIVRSTNRGMDWEIASGSSGGTFQPLLAKDGTIYWPGTNGGVSVSHDGGKTFKTVADQNMAPGIVAPAQFAELPDGRVVINGQDHLLATADQGEHWQPIGEKLPLPGGGYEGIHGLTYSAQTKTFFVWHWDCQDKVPEDAIMSMGFDWETE
jgi:hypothetical protein